jgi:hypothetical protein
LRTLVNLPSRYLLFAVVATLLLISGLSLAAARRASALTVVDCQSDCVSDRDQTLEKCNELPEASRPRCRERTQKQYEKCMEKCGGGVGL